MDFMITMVLGVGVVALGVLLLRRVNGRQAVRVADFRPGRNLSRSRTSSRTPKSQPNRQSGPSAASAASTASTAEVDAQPRRTDGHGGTPSGRDTLPPRGEGRESR